MLVKELKAIEKYLKAKSSNRLSTGYRMCDGDIIIMNDYSLIILNSITEDDKIKIKEVINTAMDTFDPTKTIEMFENYDYDEDTKELIPIADLQIVKEIKKENELGRGLFLDIHNKYPDLTYENNNVFINKELMLLVANCLGGKTIEIMVTEKSNLACKCIGKNGIAYILPIRMR